MPLETYPVTEPLLISRHEREHIMRSGLGNERNPVQSTRNGDVGQRREDVVDPNMVGDELPKRRHGHLDIWRQLWQVACRDFGHQSGRKVANLDRNIPTVDMEEHVAVRCGRVLAENAGVALANG